MQIYNYDRRGVNMKLKSLIDPPDVYWHKNGVASYVLVSDEKNGNFTTGDGTRVRVVSVDGLGEIRWDVDHHNGKVGDRLGEDKAVAFFKVKPVV